MTAKPSNTRNEEEPPNTTNQLRSYRLFPRQRLQPFRLVGQCVDAHSINLTPALVQKERVCYTATGTNKLGWKCSEAIS